MNSIFQMQFDKFITIENVPVTYIHPLMNLMEGLLRNHPGISSHDFVWALGSRWYAIRDEGMVNSSFFEDMDHYHHAIGAGCTFNHTDYSEYDETGLRTYYTVKNGKVEVI